MLRDIRGYNEGDVCNKYVYNLIQIESNIEKLNFGSRGMAHRLHFME